MDLEINEIINKILRIVDNSGLYLSPEINKETLVEIKEKLPRNQDIISFVLQTGKNKYKLAVRTYLKYKTELDFKEQTKKASLAYHQGNYAQALELNLTTLKNINKPKAYPYLFGSIGMTYLHMGIISSAITYLETATLLSKEKNKKLDYTVLINKLTKSNEPEENIEDKIEVEFSTDEFINDISNTYGISNIEEIISQINNGIKFIDIVNNLNLTKEEYLKVLLYLAKEYYSLGAFKLGDKLLYIAQKNKNKTKEIKFLIEETRNNRLFYQHREKVSHTLIKTYHINF